MGIPAFYLTQHTQSVFHHAINIFKYNDLSFRDFKTGSVGLLAYPSQLPFKGSAAACGWILLNQIEVRRKKSDLAHTDSAEPTRSTPPSAV